MSGAGFLAEPEPTEERRQFLDDDLTEPGFIMNVTRLWAHQPSALVALFDLLRVINAPHRFSYRERGILIAACTSASHDSYCTLSWGSKLAAATDVATAVSVVLGDDGPLSDTERAMAEWARKVARDPNGTSAADVQQLRDAGLTDPQIFAITAFVAARIAYATVNNALGAQPDAELAAKAPRELVEAITYGRPVEDS
ncbi:carboxymuconolactone decarboxylase family protein [Kribbella catacumbae]|uniref:carboxymuconolactone decarboxylase family protein n=1 Tax=Kribbella catacumbae TaxID=460086 RepID=UPI0003719231|nr:hypothetical protein [Kribbella catacumbae]